MDDENQDGTERAQGLAEGGSGRLQPIPNVGDCGCNPDLGQNPSVARHWALLHGTLRDRLEKAGTDGTEVATTEVAAAVDAPRGHIAAQQAYGTDRNMVGVGVAPRSTMDDNSLTFR